MGCSRGAVIRDAVRFGFGAGVVCSAPWPPDVCCPQLPVVVSCCLLLF